jgi:uncharacterized protein YukE
MARIRVSTEDLKSKAKDFESAADAFTRAGDEIAAEAISMPSYDGQLSGPARRAGYGIQSKARDMQAALAGDAASLQRTAQAFEEVDTRTVELIGNSAALLSGAPLLGGSWDELADAQGDHGGTANFGYQTVGTQYVYLFYQGRTIIIDLNAVDNETLLILLDFMKQVDDWDAALSSLSKDDVKKILEICAKFLLGGVSFLSMEITTVFGAIAGAGLWIWMFVDAVDWTKDFEEHWDALWKARDKAAEDSSWLEASDKPGVSSHPTTDEEIDNFNSGDEEAEP